MPLLSVSNLHKTYRLGRIEVPVLHGVALGVEPGEFVAILGASGSGKSTLLHLLGGLDRPDKDPKASLAFDGRDMSAFGAAELDRYRSQSIGFVFQFYHLLPELTVLENVLIGAMIRHGRLGYMRQAAALREEGEKLLDQVGLSHRLKHRPAELSGGERQRVAIARSLINRPPVLLADEPTGNLDAATGAKILDLIATLRKERGLTLVVVTHDPATAARADRTVRLVDGKVAPEPGNS